MTLEELWEIIPKEYKYIARDHGCYPHMFKERPTFDLGYTIESGDKLLVSTNFIHSCVVYERPKKMVWVVPTDEDAKYRPKCRVRDYEGDEWVYDQTLIGVSSDEKFIDMDGDIWNYCEIKKEES